MPRPCLYVCDGDTSAEKSSIFSQAVLKLLPSRDIYCTTTSSHAKGGKKKRELELLNCPVTPCPVKRLLTEAADVLIH